MALRLIALFKLLKAVVLLAIGFGALRMLRGDAVDVALTWAERLNIHPQNRYIDAALDRLSSIDQRTLASVGAGAFVYAALLVVEGVGLWRQRRWAEYVTVVITASFIPFEIQEALKRASAPRIAVIVLNAVIVGYLAWRLRAERGAQPVPRPP